MQAKGVESVRSRVANLIELNPDITPEKISESLKNEFLKEYGSWETEEVYSMSDDMPSELRELFEKYSSWEFRYGETPSFDMSFENRFTWGGIDINLSVEKGVISKAYVYSDAMDTAAAETLADLLPGTLLDRDEILKKLTEAGIKLAELEDVKNWLAEVL
jgi:lipoate-protein ligase A